MWHLLVKRVELAYHVQLFATTQNTKSLLVCYNASKTFVTLAVSRAVSAMHSSCLDYSTHIAARQLPTAVLQSFSSTR